MSLLAKFTAWRLPVRSFLAFLALAAVTALVFADDKNAPEAPKTAGPTKDGFLLPNGWHLTPVGKHAVTTDLPLNIIPLKDNKHALIASSGFNSHDLALVDLTGEPKIVAKTTVGQSWFGLAISKDESKVWWAGGGAGMVHAFDIKDAKLELTSGTAKDLANWTPSRSRAGWRSMKN